MGVNRVALRVTQRQLLGKVQNFSSNEPINKTGAPPSWHMSDEGDCSATAAAAVTVAAAATITFATKGLPEAVGRPRRHCRH